MKTEKVYAIEFMDYTNCMKDTVSDWDGDPSKLGETTYLKVGPAPFLARESDILKYQKFGGGFRSLNFVGMMECD